MTARAADRRADLAAIHILAGQLGMDTKDTNPLSEYRSMLWTVGRATSSADLDFSARARVCAHLRQLARARGIESGELHAKPDPEWDWVNRAENSKRGMLWKIRRLLINRGRPRGYADSIAKRMFRIERLELCGPNELHSIVAELNEDARRHPVVENRALTREGQP